MASKVNVCSAPVTVKLESCVASIVTVVPASISTLAAVAANVRAPADVVKLEAAAASIVTLLVASISTVEAEISKGPVVVISTSLALPAIFTPAAPSNVRVPTDVVKLEAPLASILTPPLASIVIPPAVALMSIAFAPVPAELTITCEPKSPTAAKVKLDPSFRAEMLASPVEEMRRPALPPTPAWIDVDPLAERFI